MSEKHYGRNAKAINKKQTRETRQSSTEGRVNTAYIHQGRVRQQDASADNNRDGKLDVKTWNNTKTSKI